MAKIFKVGGFVRDKLIGIDSKDIDFTFVCDESTTIDEGWKEMKTWLKDNQFEIFLETKDCFTVRAKFPKNHQFAGLVADFVMARKEVGYFEGTRKPILELGTLQDDLERRDFTVNAIAEDIDGNIIDPFNGRQDLKVGVLRTPKDPKITLMEDPLRILRALRFSITKRLRISFDIIIAMEQNSILDKLKTAVSQERIREEVTKMMKFDTIETIKLLRDIDYDIIPGLLNVIFQDNMWLEPTTKKRKN